MRVCHQNWMIYINNNNNIKNNFTHCTTGESFENKYKLRSHWFESVWWINELTKFISVLLLNRYIMFLVYGESVCLFEVKPLWYFHTIRTERDKASNDNLWHRNFSLFMVVVIKALQIFCNNHYLCFSQTAATADSSTDSKAVFTMT